MTKYRIVQLDEDLFQVQFKNYMCWKELNHHGSLKSAMRCVEYLRNNTYPKVINY